MAETQGLVSDWLKTKSDQSISSGLLSKQILQKSGNKNQTNPHKNLEYSQSHRLSVASMQLVFFWRQLDKAFKWLQTSTNKKFWPIRCKYLKAFLSSFQAADWYLHSWLPKCPSYLLEFHVRCELRIQHIGQGINYLGYHNFLFWVSELIFKSLKNDRFLLILNNGYFDGIGNFDRKRRSFW